jgi:CHAT domain-containing protein
MRCILVKKVIFVANKILFFKMKKNVFLLLFWWGVGSLLSAQQLPNLPELKPNRFNSKGQREGKWVIWRNDKYSPYLPTTMALYEKSNTTLPDSVKYYGYLTFRDGQPIDTFRLFYRTGELYFVGKLYHFELDTLDGYCTWYHESGEIRRSGLYIEGKPEGKHFDDMVFMKKEYTYKKGEIDTTKIYNKDNVLIHMSPVNGKGWDENDEEIETGMFINSRKEGIWTTYYPDSSIKKQEFYQNGRLLAEDNLKMKKMQFEASWALIPTSDTTPISLRKGLGLKNYLYHEKLRASADEHQGIKGVHLRYTEIALLEAESAYGRGHIEYFRALVKWYLSTYGEENFLEIYEKTVAAKKAWDIKTTKKPFSYSNVLSILITACEALEKYQEAEYYLEEFAAIEQYKNSYNLINAQFNFHKSIKEYKKAIHIGKKLLSLNKRNILTDGIAIQLASVYSKLGHPDSALITLRNFTNDSLFLFYHMSQFYKYPHVRDSSKIMLEYVLKAIRAKNHDLKYASDIDTNNILHDLYLLKNDINKVIALTEKDYNEKQLFKYTKAMVLSYLYSMISDFKKSKLYFDIYKDYVIKLVDKKHTAYFSILEEDAIQYANMGDTQKALNLLEQLYQDTLLPSKLKADTAFDLSKLYKTLGQYESAFQLDTALLVSEKIKYGEKSINLINWLHYIGKYYIVKNNYAKATDYLDNAKQITEKAWGKYIKYASLLKDEAIVYENQKAFSMALQCQDSAALIYQQTVGKNSISYAQLLIDQSQLYRKMDNFPKAFELNHQARSILKKISPDTLILDYQRNNAELFHLQLLNNAPNNAFSSIQTHYSSFLKHIEKGFNSLNRAADGDKSKAQLLQARLAVFNTYKTVAYQLAARSQPEMTAFLYEMALFQKEIVLNDVRFIRLMEVASDSATFELFQKWQKLNYQTMNKPYWFDSESEGAEWRNDSIVCTQLFETLLKRSKIFKQTRAIVHWKDVQARLKDGEVAIEYDMVPLADSEKTLYYALIIQKKALSPVFLPLFDEKELKTLLDESKLDDTRDAVISRYNNSGYGGGELYQLIWSKIDSVLKRSQKPVHTIFLATTGLLENIAFDILPTRHYSFQKDTLLLSDVYKIHRVRSTRELVISDVFQRIKDKPNVLLYGSINYNADSTVASVATGDKGGYFHATTVEPVQLYTSMVDETQQVQQTCNANQATITIKQGNDATEGHFKNLNGKSFFDIIHFNTHGVYVENGLTDPLYRSYLTMAGCNKYLKNPHLKMAEDGLLTAHEIALVDLTQTQLVVLSACQTALGDIQGSEGVYGLRRALRLAGTDFILVSLWKVPSEATTTFMTLFYQNLLTKMPIRAAFEQTQKTMRRNYPNPNDKHHWAAWVLIQ